MPSGGANYGCGTVVDAISGNVFVGTKIKFTNDEMVAMINSGNDSGLGIAMFTGSGDVYTGIQFWATQRKFCAQNDAELGCRRVCHARHR